MARDSRGRFVRVAGSGRRLRVTGVEYGDEEVGGVRSGPVVYLSGGPEPKPVEEAPKPTRKG